MRILTFSLLMTLVLSVGPAFASDEYVFDQIVVKVNDEIITQYDLDARLDPILKNAKAQGRVVSDEVAAEIRKKILEDMIREKLIEAEIRKYGITVSQKEIDNEIKFLQDRLGLDDAQFAARLKKDGMTEEALRAKLADTVSKQKLVSGMVHAKVLVTDTDVKKEYEARKAQYSTGRLVKVSVIMLPEEMDADKLRERIIKKELTFAEAADKYTTGPGKGQGGDIGELGWKDLAEQWRKALEGLKAGEISKPIKIQGAPALLLLRESSAGTVTPLAEVRDGIYKELLKKRREQVFEEYFKGLHDKAVIQYSK